NVSHPAEQWQLQDLEALGDFSEAEYEALLEALRAARGMVDARDTDAAYEAPAPVDFRGDFQPHMVQLLLQLQAGQNHQGEDQPLSQQMLEHLVQESVALAQDIGQDDLTQDMPGLAQRMMQAAGMPTPQANPGQGHRPGQHDHGQGEALTPQEPRAYVYDEWDFCATAYKPRWCMVKEKVLEEGETTCYNEALQTHSALLSR